MKLNRSKKIKITLAAAAGIFLTGLAVIYFAGRPPESEVDVLIYYLGRHDTIFTRIYTTIWRASPTFVQSRLRRPGLTDLDRARAAEFLEDMGPRARKALPALIGALDDPNPQVRFAALGAMRTIGQGSGESVRAAVRKLSDRNSEVRFRAASVLARLKMPCDEAVEPLINLLQKPFPATVGLLFPIGGRSFEAIEPGPLVLRALLIVGPNDHRVGDAFFQAAQGKIRVGFEAQRFAIASLTKIAPTSEQVAAFFDEGLAKETSPQILLSLLEGVKQMTTGADRFVPRLEEIMQHPRVPQWGLEIHAAEALWQLAPEAARANMQFYIDHSANDYRISNILSEMKPNRADTIPRLVAQIETVPEVRLGLLAEAIWGIDPMNKEIVPRLWRTLDSTNGSARAHAAYELWKVNGETNLAIRVLTNALQEPPNSYSQLYPQLLARMGVAAQAALPALRTAAITHQNQFARARAQDAVDKIEAELRRAQP